MPDPDATAPPPAADLTGRTLGDFHILRRLGAGGMGQVYLARQRSLKRDVALKLLRGELNTHPTALKRFEAEAQAVARLNHPSIVQVYQIGESDGLRYMALEYVEGRNLRDFLARKGPPDLPVCLSVIRQVSQALQKAHEQGIVHRDIKPENILITRKVEVKVTDFGLSRFFAGEPAAVNLTQSGVTLGTPLYMSPEQVQGNPVDHRSDVYSLGVTCYHLLAGEPPFRGTTAFDVAMKHVQERPRPLAGLRPDLPGDLCGMVHKMMAKDPADRYASARDVLRDLAKVREGLNLGLTQMALSGTATPAAGAAPAAVGLSGSGPGVAAGSGHGLGPPPALSGPVGPPAAGPGVRWGGVFAVAAGGLLAAAGGAAVYAALHASADPAAGASPPAGPGLPDVRPHERLTTTRERDLLALLDKYDTKADKRIGYTIELGLLLLRERRADDAEARFRKLEGEPLGGSLYTAEGQTVGRLGRAVVLAHRDPVPDTPDAARKLAADSNRLFEDAVKDAAVRPFGKGPPAKNLSGLAACRAILLKHPDLAQAVSEAINRNAENLGVRRLPTAALEVLRSPKEVARPGKD